MRSYAQQNRHWQWLIICVIAAVLFSFLPQEPSYAEEYGFQGLTGTVEIPGKGSRDTNNIKLVEPENITVEHTTTQPEGYFLNTIDDIFDGSDRIDFAFCMTAGMNDIWTSNERTELKFVGLNLDPDPSVNSSREEALTGKLTQVNIYKAGDGEEYDGTWLGTKEAVANYQKGNLKVDYSRSYGNLTSNDRTGRITLYIPENTLSSGEYILEFGPDTCGNEPLKVPVVPIAFKFVVKGNYTFEQTVTEAQRLCQTVVTGVDTGQYGQDEYIVLQETLEAAQALQEDSAATDEEKDEMAEQLSAAIQALEKSRIVDISIGDITGIDQNVYVGSSGIVKTTVSAEPSDLAAYGAMKWQSEDETVLSVDSQTGAYTANRAGTTTLRAVSKWNEQIEKSFEVTVQDKDDVFSVNIPKNSTLEEIVMACGKDTEEISLLRVYTAEGVSLTAEDFAFIKTMNNLKSLDLLKASCTQLPSGSILSGCTALEKLLLPENLTTISDQAFQNCSGLTQIEIPASVNSIGAQIFEGCDALRDVTIRSVRPPECTTSVSYSFKGSFVERVHVPYGCGDEYREDDAWNAGLFTLIEDSQEDILKVVVSETGGLETAAEEALGTASDKDIDTLVIRTEENQELSDVKDIPYLKTHFLNATTIDLSEAQLQENQFKGGIFENRTNLKKLRLNDNITAIGAKSFRSCINLQDLVLPASLKGLSEGTFSDCERLGPNLVINAKEPPTYNGAPFIPGTVSTIVVPPGCEKAYQADSGWSQFKIISQITMTLSKTSLTLEVPATYKLTATPAVYGGDPDDVTVKWTSSNTSVAKVSAAMGKSVTVSTLKPGTATITASDVTGHVTAACKVTVKAMAAPTVKAASYSYNAAKVTWSGVSGAAGYEVFRATSKTGSYTKIRTLTASARSYLDTGRSTGTTYYYKVRAYKTVNKTNYAGTYSAIVSAKPVPAAPTGVKTAKGGSKKIKVSWKKVSGASGYVVYRSTKKTTGYKAVKTIKSAKTVKYTTGKLKKGTTYYFKVRAYRTVKGKKVYGSYSAIVSRKAK